MRSALVNKDGVVENVIIAGPGYKPPEGYKLVQSERAGIGHQHINGEFVDPYRPSKEGLLAHAESRHRDIEYFPLRINAGGKKISLTVFQHDIRYIEIMAARAKVDSKTTINYPNPKTGEFVRLNAAALIALDEAITSYLVEHKMLYGEVVAAIHAGEITKDSEVDHPPMRSWPPRHDEPVA